MKKTEKKRQRRRQVGTYVVFLCSITSKMCWSLCVSVRRAVQVDADQKDVVSLGSQLTLAPTSLSEERIANFDIHSSLSLAQPNTYQYIFCLLGVIVGSDIFI